MLSFRQGWNFISFSKEPTDKNVLNALKTILTNIHTIWGYDNETNKWEVYKSGIQGSTFKTLEYIESGKGYWVYMNSPCILDMKNWVKANTKVPLYPGWNLIGWAGDDGKQIEAALSTISNKWIVIWGWENGKWYARHSDPNIPLNAEQLTVLNRGKAYWIKIKDHVESINFNFYPPIIQVSPKNIDFSEQYVGNQVTYHALILSNTGLSSFSIKTIAISGDNADDFTYTSSCLIINVGSSCDILVHFKPSSEGIKNAELIIQSDEAGLERMSIPLSGKGKKAPPPEIVSYSPANNAIEVSTSTSINVKFNDIMDSSTINNSTITVKANGVNIPGVVTYNASTKTATFKPSQSLSKGMTYTVTVSEECKNTLGAKMASPFSWTFTTIESASGLWEGTFTSNVLNKTYKVIGVITEDGEARLLSEEGAQYNGSIPVNAKTVNASFTAFAPYGYVFPNGSNYGTVLITATVKTKNSLTGWYNGVGDNGVFDLKYSSIYERGSSISLLTGSWSNTNQYGYSHYLTVYANGTFTGYNNYGCTFSGTINIIDPLYNAYRIKNVTIKNCDVLNGTYNGVGVLIDIDSQNDGFIMGISNSFASLVMTFKR